MAKNKVVESLKLGAWLTATILLVNWLLAQVGISVVPLYSVQGVTGITTTVGARLVSFVEGLGIVSLDITSLLYLYISASVIVLVGTYLYDMVDIPKTRKAWTKLAVILLYGTLAFYLVFVGFVLKAWTVWVGLALYYGVVVIMLGMLQDLVPKYIKL